MLKSIKNIFNHLWKWCKQISEWAHIKRSRWLYNEVKIRLIVIIVIIILKQNYALKTTRTHTCSCSCSSSMTRLINDMAFIFKCTAERRRDMQPDMKNGKMKNVYATDFDWILLSSRRENHLPNIQLFLSLCVLMSLAAQQQTNFVLSIELVYCVLAHSINSFVQINILAQPHPHHTHNKNNNFLSSNSFLFSFASRTHACSSICSGEKKERKNDKSKAK